MTYWKPGNSTNTPPETQSYVNELQGQRCFYTLAGSQQITVCFICHFFQNSKLWIVVLLWARTATLNKLFRFRGQPLTSGFDPIPLSAEGLPTHRMQLSYFNPSVSAPNPYITNECLRHQPSSQGLSCLPVRLLQLDRVYKVTQKVEFPTF